MQRKLSLAMTNIDKEIEKNRYDKSARIALDSNAQRTASGSMAIPEALRSPYICYEKQLRRVVKSEDRVLEIGAGTGMHTQILIDLVSKGHVFATDISETALMVLRNNIYHPNRLIISVADMESLPFSDDSFDVVVSAGSLSYGAPETLLNEIRRVLKPQGFFCCVDSLNHNLIYRFNRLVHFFCGRRSWSTLQRMPTMITLAEYKRAFGFIDTKFFGSVSWITPVLERLFGSRKASIFSDWFDCWISVEKSAFKFVMLARNIN